MIYIGLPQWTHPIWSKLGLGIRSLADYAHYFNCVEGDTTLYALPSQETVLRWHDQTHDAFRFCFKFPGAITHQSALRDCADLRQAFLTRMSPLAERIGQLWLQLPARFGPDDLPALWHFLDNLSDEYRYGVEVRHPQFFARGEDERALNAGLHARSVNRVILDSRPVHYVAATTPAFHQAQRQKPKLPVHALLTAQDPMIRFIPVLIWPLTNGCLLTGYRACKNGSHILHRGFFYTRLICAYLPLLYRHYGQAARRPALM